MRFLLKILNKVFFILCGLIISNLLDTRQVLAAEMTTTFSGYYWDRKSSDYHGSGSFRYYYIDGMDSYCLDPDTHEGSPLELGNWESSGVSNDIKERVLLIVYYGYNYTGHQTLEYRAATQALLWETIKGGDTKVTFYTQRFAVGTELDISKERNEIERLISSHSLKPSFNGNVYNVQVGDSLILEDTNNVLSDFDVKVNNADWQVDGNKLIITPTTNGTINISLTKKTPYFESYKIFVGDMYQNQIVPGTVDPIVSSFRIKAFYGKVNITKVDSETITAQGDATLEGTIYGIYDTNDELISKIITDKNGYATSGNILKFGNYYIKEISAPTGYKIDNTKYYFEINESNEINLELSENVIKGRIKIIKQDFETNSCLSKGDTTLEGTIYEIRDKNNNVVDTIIIGKDCTSTSKELPYGKYTVKETSAPIGYYLDLNIYTVDIKSSDTVSVVSKDEVIKGRIKVNKYDSETNSCIAQGQATLKGAVYEILDLKGNVVDTLTIGDDCSATSKYLPYSQYKIREKKESQGYYIDTNIYSANITEDNVITITSKERVIKNYISILKQYDYVDGTTQFLNAESNVTFEISYLDGTKYGEIKTDKNGYATLDIPYGVWKFHQVNSNNGFEKIYDFYITVDENSEKEQYYNILNNKISAYLQVVKKDSETGKTVAISNTKFKILNTDTNQYVSQYVGGKVYDNFLTDENGTFTTYLKLEAGNYKLVEIESPIGYLISKDGLAFTIGENTEYNYTTYGAIVVVEFENIPIKGQVEIFKSGEKFIVENETFKYQDIKLSGIKFNLYADEDIKSADDN